MKTVTKIVCRTIGTLGMGYALYDAAKVAKQYSRNEALMQDAKHFQRVYTDTRTIDTVSFTDSTIQKKASDIRMKNPLYSVWGTVKGGVTGFLSGMGNHIFTVACSAFALASKGTMAKIGAIGTGLCACVNIARNAYGIGKHTPLD